MCKGRGTSKSAAFQELQVKAVLEGRVWKGELGSNMGELEEFGLYPTISGTKECSQFAPFSCSLLLYQRVSCRTQCEWTFGDSVGNPLVVLRQRVG